MSSFTADSKVIIVGAGPGGLALAQVLRANKIRFEIFERETDSNDRRQGWSFGLIEAIQILPPLLPEGMGNISQVSVNHNTGDLDAMTILDCKTAEVRAVIGNRPHGQPGHMIRGVRQRLRDYLSQELDIQIGKDFSHYEEQSDGVTVFFKDGSSARGDILVAADGANSRIRTQLIDDESTSAGKIVLSEWIPIFGECDLPRSVYEAYHNLSSAGMMTATDKVRFQISPRSLKPDRSSAEYYWTVVFMSDDPAADSAWVQHASGKSLYRRALELTDGFHPFLTDIIHRTVPAGMVTAPPKFIEFVPPKALPRGRVTLLGDAAHAMTPFKGVGCNTAIRDACDLAQLLTSSATDKEMSIDWLLQQYEKIMLTRGRDMVLSSRAAGKDAKGIMASMEGRVNTHDKKDKIEVKVTEQAVAA